jgi:hypothetical protein
MAGEGGVPGRISAPMSAPHRLRWLWLLGLLGMAPVSRAEPADPTLAILQRTDAFLHRGEVDGVTRDPRNLWNPPEEIRLSLIPQLLGYCELFQTFPHTTAYQDIVDRADFLLAHRGEATSGSAFDGMLVLAFLQAHAITGDARYRAAAEPYLATFRAMSETQLHLNGGLMVAMALAEDARATGSVASLNKVHEILLVVAREQNRDGSFPHYCPGTRDIHYSAWMAMELILIGERVSDPLIDQMLAGVNGFLCGRVDAEGNASYEDVAPSGARAVFYSLGDGCADYDTRGWSNELGYAALLFDHFRDVRAGGELDRLNQLQDQGAFPDKWAYMPDPNDPVFPWANASHSVIRTSVIFWSLASLYAARGTHVPVHYEPPASDEVAADQGVGDQRESTVEAAPVPDDGDEAAEDLAAYVAQHEAPAAIVPLGAESEVATTRAAPAATEQPLPKELSLGLARPNPAADGCAFALRLPEASEVRLRVFDGTGRLVRDLSPGALPAGTRTLRWDGRDQAGRLAPAGLYWIEARAREWRARTRVTLAR